MKKTIRFLYFFFCFGMMFTLPAHAYLDPSIVTYSTQVIAGILVVVGTVVGLYWRRAKKKVQKKLGIDENAKKEIEEDVVELNDDEEN